MNPSASEISPLSLTKTPIHKERPCAAQLLLCYLIKTAPAAKVITPQEVAVQNAILIAPLALALTPQIAMPVFNPLQSHTMERNVYLAIRLAPHVLEVLLCNV